jgi:hypothetical protein
MARLINTNTPGRIINMLFTIGIMMAILAQVVAYRGGQGLE